MQSSGAAAMKRAECPELIVDFVAGTLDPAEEAAFLRHIETCAACRRAVDGQRAVWLALDEWRGLVLTVAGSRLR
jgi:anti-sigma factor RsiW